MNSTSSNAVTPKVGERWRVRVISTLPERAGETFLASVAAQSDGTWQVTPEGHSKPWPIWFGRAWFISPA